MAATMVKLAFPNHFPLITKEPIKPTNRALSSKNYSLCPSKNGNFSTTSENNNGRVKKMIGEFNREIPIEEAFTPPSSWYTDSEFYTHELTQIFYRGWQPVGYTDQVKEPRDFFTGRLGSVEYVVSRDEEGELYAFHNVCRHRASPVASGTGKSSCFVCPYHGWTYGLDGKLLKATSITGIKNFEPSETGLVSIRVAVWGPFVLVNFEDGANPNKILDNKDVSSEWLGNAAELLTANGIDTSLDYVRRRVYTLECNWKVFCDNFLDGGYHVPYVHKGFASSLKLDSYSTEVYEKVSVQRCRVNNTNGREEECDRLGSKAFYAFVYPNFMISRYGPWMETNLVLPLGPKKCHVIFDYFLETPLTDNIDFIEKSLETSHGVQFFYMQEEDMSISTCVQKGLESPAYQVGRYCPNVEMAVHHFHCLLHRNLTR
ncbi:hypothetical protein ABFS83_10G072100 [Erythranthe nasuta]